MQQCDFSCSAVGRRRWECPSSSNLAEQEEICLSLPRDNPSESRRAWAQTRVHSRLPLPACTEGARGQWKRGVPSTVACCLSGIRCSSTFALAETMRRRRNHRGRRQQHPGIRAWSLKGFKQGQTMPEVSVGNGTGTQAWNTARAEPEALDLPAGAFCKSLHPGEVLRVVPTPHMKSDG